MRSCNRGRIAAIVPSSVGFVALRDSFFSAPAELSAAAESFLKKSELKVIDL